MLITYTFIKQKNSRNGFELIIMFLRTSHRLKRKTTIMRKTSGFWVDAYFFNNNLLILNWCFFCDLFSNHVLSIIFPNTTLKTLNRKLVSFFVHSREGYSSKSLFKAWTRKKRERTFLDWDKTHCFTNCFSWNISTLRW